MLQDKIDRYAKQCALLKRLKAKNEALRHELIEVLRTRDCPTKGPFLIELSTVKRTKFDWKVFARYVAKLLWGKDYKIHIVRAKQKAGKTDIPVLHVKVNPKWKG